MMFVHFGYRVWHALGLDEARRFELISVRDDPQHRQLHDRVRVWLKRLYEWFAEGLTLRRRVPRAMNADPAAAQKWRSEMDRWYDDTQNMLKKYSVQSAAALVLEPAQPTLEFHGIDPTCHQHFRVLTFALANLKEIMEKPDIYF